LEGLEGLEEVSTVVVKSDYNNNNNNNNTDQENCTRLATIGISTKAGLGHRFGELVMGLNLARATNASFIYPTDAWSKGKRIHGSYPWWNEFFPLQDTHREGIVSDMNLGDLFAGEGDPPFSIVRGHFDHLVEVANNHDTLRCNLLFHMKGLQSCCPKPEMTRNCWCPWYPERTGAYDSVKGVLREVYANHSRYVPLESPLALPPADNDKVVTVSVAWHIRLGDIVLNARRDFFSRIANHVAEAFRDANENNKNLVLRPHVFMFGEGGESGIQRNFPFVAEVCREHLGDRCTYPETDPRDTLWGMIHSDVLVTSGSSFPIVATELRTRGVVLAAYPKEGRSSSLFFYKVSEQVDILQDGSIPGIRRLRDFLVTEDWANARSRPRSRPRNQRNGIPAR